jgi:hypothetical protein
MGVKAERDAACRYVLVSIESVPLPLLVFTKPFVVKLVSLGMDAPLESVSTVVVAFEGKG